ncbi:MAG: biotin transporter BioY [Bacilli bacterium]|nr:biotin transporter BioY [Bacilli bacterium]
MCDMNNENISQKAPLFSTKDIALSGLLIALIAVCSFITIPMVVPFTLQILAIFLIIYLQGPIKSLITISIYVLAGLIGCPVFAGFNGGPAYLLGPTGGFIIGFLLMPLAYLPFYLTGHKKMIHFIIAMVIGLLLLYLFGTFWFILVYKHGDASIWNVMSITVFPFILPDVIKLVVAALLGYRIKKIYRNI